MNNRIIILILSGFCLLFSGLAFYYANQIVKLKRSTDSYRQATEEAEKRFVQMKAEESRSQQIARMEANECERQIIELSKALRECKGQ
ncbi:hypothetical protein [Reichenbachiella versicolor]|uniref:hypothetical protein n=1 Tax=Reichenbachiella versicolor TaxID=1821036 RepID=UPI000D6E3DBF|nr:hypothetical protein [Reichenbachiella versicolor]